MAGAWGKGRDRWLRAEGGEPEEGGVVLGAVLPFSAQPAVLDGLGMVAEGKT